MGHYDEMYSEDEEEKPKRYPPPPQTIPPPPPAPRYYPYQPYTQVTVKDRGIGIESGMKFGCGYFLSMLFTSIISTLLGCTFMVILFVVFVGVLCRMALSPFS